MVAATPSETIRGVDRIGIQDEPTAPVAVGILTVKINLVVAAPVDDAQNPMIAKEAERTVASNYVAPKFRLGKKQSRRCSSPISKTTASQAAMVVGAEAEAVGAVAQAEAEAVVGIARAAIVAVAEVVAEAADPVANAVRGTIAIAIQFRVKRQRRQATTVAGVTEVAIAATETAAVAARVEVEGAVEVEEAAAAIETAVAQRIAPTVGPATTTAE